MRPIPVSLLPDTVSVAAPAGDGFGGQFGEPVTISNVRFDRSAGVSPNEHSMRGGSKGTLFVDAVNSGGAFRMQEGSQVTLGGETLFVESVEEFAGMNGAVHHWEVSLR